MRRNPAQPAAGTTQAQRSLVAEVAAHREALLLFARPDLSMAWRPSYISTSRLRGSHRKRGLARQLNWIDKGAVPLFR